MFWRTNKLLTASARWEWHFWHHHSGINCIDSDGNRGIRYLSRFEVYSHKIQYNWLTFEKYVYNFEFFLLDLSENGETLYHSLIPGWTNVWKWRIQCIWAKLMIHRLSFVMNQRYNSCINAPNSHKPKVEVTLFFSILSMWLDPLHQPRVWINVCGCNRALIIESYKLQWYFQHQRIEEPQSDHTLSPRRKNRPTTTRRTKYTRSTLILNKAFSMCFIRIDGFSVGSTYLFDMIYWHTCKVEKQKRKSIRMK